MITVNKRIFFVACCVTLLCVACLPNLMADEWNKKTQMTFSGPVEVPGIVLPAGTYVFKLLESASNRHIVQIFNADETHVYATILAIPNYRLQPTGETVIKFEERAVNAPEAVKAWFYPGDNFGQEFVYPKVKAQELARANKQPVLSMPTEMATIITEPAKSATEPPVVALKQAPVEPVTPEKTEIAMAEPALPKTAGPWPLVALIGLLCLGAAGALRLVSRRMS